MKLSKICLGTAQLGMPYGISNLAGQPDRDQGLEIISFALANGIRAFDTSPEYGESEKLLGTGLKGYWASDLVFISKVPPMHEMDDPDSMKAKIDVALDCTLSHLGIQKLTIYLFHRFKDLMREHHLLLKHLVKLKQSGLIDKIGVSIYTPQEAEISLQIPEIEVIQAPFNLLDKRLLANGFLAKAQEKGITILARSVFLQGLIFKHEIPSFFNDFKPFQEKIQRICQESSLSVAELALRYVLGIDGLSSLILGVESLHQLQENLNLINKGPLTRSVINKVQEMGTAPEHIIDPRLWQQN